MRRALFIASTIAFLIVLIPALLYWRSEGRAARQFRNSSLWQVLTPWSKYADPLRNSMPRGVLGFGQLNVIELGARATSDLTLEKITVEVIPIKFSYLHIIFHRENNDFYS